MTNFKTLTLAILTSCILISCGSSDDVTPESNTSLIDGEVATFLFDGNLKDGQGTFANATVNGATLTEDRKGNANSAYLFDGEDDYISFGDNALYKGNDAFSISIWAKPATHSGIIFNKEGEYELALEQEKCRTQCENNGKYFKWAMSTGTSSWSWQNTSIPFTEDAWNHVVLTFSKGDIKIYLDGALKVEQTRTDQTVADSEITLNELRIGGRQSGSQFFEGALDDLRFYDFAVTSSNIATLYADK
jgi:hypothetical protein